MRRIFVAVRLPASLSGGVEAAQESLDPRLVDIKWVEPASLHLTLRFFGALEDKELIEVERVVTEVAGATSAFTVRLEGVGTFPARGRPRVIWIGMGEGSERLEAMAAALEQAFVKAGLGKADRPFTPHLTVGRVRDPNRRGKRGGPVRERMPLQATVAMHAAIGEARFGPADFEVHEVAVVESRLSPRGPTYLDVYLGRLAGGPAS